MGINEIDDKLLDLITNEEKIAPHFHLSLQSGDDRVLKDMKRGYTVKEYSDIVNEIVKRRPDTAIGTDVITGFPTETEEAFNNTVKLVEELPFSYIHVFTYSNRKGTKAEKFGDRVKSEEKKRRTRILIEISERKNYRFRNRYLNKTLEVLVISDKGEYKVGLTGNYIHIRFKTEKGINNIATVKLTDIGIKREDNIGVEISSLT